MHKVRRIRLDNPATLLVHATHLAQTHQSGIIEVRYPSHHWIAYEHGVEVGTFWSERDARIVLAVPTRITLPLWLVASLLARLSRLCSHAYGAVAHAANTIDERFV